MTFQRENVDFKLFWVEISTMLPLEISVTKKYRPSAFQRTSNQVHNYFSAKSHYFLVTAADFLAKSTSGASEG